MPHTATHSPPTTSQSGGRLDQLSAETASLFVYGSLRFPDVLLALLDRVPTSTPAQASGWRAAALRGYAYPALVPASGSADGLLLTGLTADEWRILDDFENDLYQLHRLPLDGDREGWAYVSEGDAAVLPHDWNARHFTQHDLTAYVERCREWRQEYEARST